MPVNTLQFADGVTLEVNDGAASAYVGITDLETLDAPGATVKMVERKRLANTGLVEKVPSPRKDPGECAFTYELTDVLHVRMDALLGVTGKGWRVTYPDGLRLAFTGTLSENKPQQSKGEEIQLASAKVTVQSLIALSDTIP
jgi:hypothetical protein